MIKSLFLIDFQNDFCIDSKVAARLNCKTGALAVPGAWEDGERLAKFIESNIDDIDRIFLTQDTHHVIDISHPSFWADKDGNSPAPFTQITAQDVHNGTWIARYSPLAAIKYIEDLEKNGEFTHTIWPEHCINGSWGAAIIDPVIDSVKEWCNKRRKLHVMVQKGEYPLTEHFGALRANVQNMSVPATMVNQQLIQVLLTSDVLYLAGEAKSHCVANTLKQLMEEAPALVSKIIVLEDCMSNVGGIEWDSAEEIYREAKKSGVKFIKTI